MTEDIYADWRTLIDAGEVFTPTEAEAMFQTLLARDEEIRQLKMDAYDMYNGWRESNDVSGPMKQFRNHHLTMLYLDGSKISFHCHCGCNVFFKGTDEQGAYYECNACNDKYRESPEESKEL